MTSPRTLNDLYFGMLDRCDAGAVVMRYREGESWRDITYAGLADRVRHVSLGLTALGVNPGDRVAILSGNCPEWAVADLACLTTGCTDVPVYPTLPAAQAAYILRDAGVVALFVENAELLAKVQEARKDVSTLRHVIAFDPAVAGGDVQSLAALMDAGKARDTDPAAWRTRAQAVGPDDVATFIYTSGTTGDPKGVMLSHGNITSNVLSSLTAFELETTDECLSFLPLSHIFERMAGQFIMLWSGVTINYAGSIETVPQDMQAIRPTVMVSVPRLYEKIYGRVLENVMAAPALRQKIFFWAKRVGERWADLTIAGKPVPGLLAFQKRLGDKLVFSKLRARTGGRVKFFVSGGAPLNADIARFFYAAGMPILEGYGLTETSPVIAVNTFDHLRLGTVGHPLSDVEVRIAADGEILCRGPNVMKGYYNKPEATAEVMGKDGWFHTGDIGLIDQDGFLKITDRKKDIIVTAGGKNIAPQPIENRLKTNPLFLNAVMIGDRHQFPIVLVAPNFDKVRERLAAEGQEGGPDEVLAKRPEVRALVEQAIANELRDLARYEMPKKVGILARDFAIESGELTPTLKVKRRVVEQRHADLIARLYAEAEGGTTDIDGRA